MAASRATGSRKQLVGIFDTAGTVVLAGLAAAVLLVLLGNARRVFGLAESA